MLLDGANMAPQVPTNVLISGLLSAWASQRYALRKHPRWYEKYSELGLQQGTVLKKAHANDRFRSFRSARCGYIDTSAHCVRLRFGQLLHLVGQSCFG